MDAPVTLGVIGAGYAAEQLHWPALRRISQLRVVAVTDLDRGRAEELVSRLPGARVAADSQAIIANNGVEAVAILTPPESHGALMAAAWDAGKDVFVEKPLTSIPEELDWLMEKGRSSGRVVAVGHNLRCHRLVRKARAVIKSGALGEILAIRAIWTSPPREAPASIGLGGSVLLDLGVHHIDLVACLGGAPVESVDCTIDVRDPAHESALLAGQLRGGTLFNSIVAKRGIPEHSIHVAGTAGAIEFSFQRANSWRQTLPTDLGLRAQTTEIGQYLRQLPDLFKAIGSGGDWLQSYEAQWRAFASSVRRGTPVECSIEEAAAAVKVCAELAARALHQTV